MRLERTDRGPILVLGFTEGSWRRIVTFASGGTAAARGSDAGLRYSGKAILRRVKLTYETGVFEPSVKNDMVQMLKVVWRQSPEVT